MGIVYKVTGFTSVEKDFEYLRQKLWGMGRLLGRINLNTPLIFVANAMKK